MPLKDLVVLVVEDQYFLATELTSVLRELGAQVLGPMARLPQDGSLDICGHVDAALVNLGPVLDMKLSLIEEIRSRGVPVALVTGYGPCAIPAQYSDLPRLDKPIDRNKLISALLRLAAQTKESPHGSPAYLL
jgi:hypothetical protein